MSMVEKMYPTATDGVDDREQPDYTDKYNTKLTPDQETAFQTWIAEQGKKLGRNLANDTFDYDLRGFYLQSGGADLSGGHLTDEFKKPNHPTFSTDSKYSGVDGMVGGKWLKKDGKYEFVPSPQNLKNLGKDGLRRYFQESEPNVDLVIE